MTKGIHETVATALLDAVAVGAAAETADAVASVANNLAVERYRVDHPDEELDDEAWLDAIKDGRALLAIDGVDWLLSKGHLRRTPDGGLDLGKPYRVSSGKGKSKVTYVAGAHREEDLFRSLRRVTSKRVELLRESIETFGDLREFFPVLVDTNGNVVDGRHRRVFDPAWPASPRKVPVGTRLAAGAVANRTNAWTAEDWARLATTAEFVNGRKATAGERARLALLDNHERSNRDIARALGPDCSPATVQRARVALEEIGSVSQFRDHAGAPTVDGSPARPRDEIRDAVRPYAIEELGGSKTFDREVAKVLGDQLERSHGTVEEVYREVLAHERGRAEGFQEAVQMEPEPESEDDGLERLSPTVVSGTAEQVAESLQAAAPSPDFLDGIGLALTRNA